MMNLTKGIQVYTYIAIPGCRVEFSVPKCVILHNQFQEWSNDHLEVEKRNIPGFFNSKGRFSFSVYENGMQLTHQWVDINTLTGELGDGTMNDLKHTPSVLASNTVITYGFYHAGIGHAGLPDRCQCYVTVTPNCSAWMATVAPAGSSQAEQMFSRFVLPSAHDVGMNDEQNTHLILTNAMGKITQLVKDKLPLFDLLSRLWAQVMAPHIVYGLAFTQKDDLTTMLVIGARYFEFRPAHIHKDIFPASGLEDKLYFQHACFPGMAYDEFLYSIVKFLMNHESEIIVVQIRYDGILEGCKLATETELQGCLDNALAHVSNAIACGTLDDMKTLSISQLRNMRKRLILFPPAEVFSTYSEVANATLSGESIIAAYYEKLHGTKQVGKALTNIQCQATASAIPEVLTHSVTSSKASTSCLMATKAVCDSKTLPWIRKNALERLPAEQLVVIMNDFIDGATVDVAIDLSRRRLNK